MTAHAGGRLLSLGIAVGGADAQPFEGGAHAAVPAACSSTSSAWRSRRATPTMSQRSVASAAGDGPCTAFGHDATASASTMRRWSTAPPRMARISTTRSRAGRCMPARSSCRRCWRSAETRGLPARRRHARHRGRRRADVPAEPRRAAGDPQGRLPSDGRARRAGGGRRGVGARSALDDETICRRARHRRQPGLGHHRISRRRQLDQAAACRRGGAGRAARRAAGRGRLRRPAARCSRAATASSRPSRRRACRISHRCSTGSAATGSWSRSPSSPMPAEP